MQFIELHRNCGMSDMSDPILVNLDKVIAIYDEKIITEGQTAFYVRESYDEIKSIIKAVSEMDGRFDKYLEKNSSEGVI